MADLFIDKMKSALVGGGARSNYFEVELALPGIVGATFTPEEVVLVKAAQMPASVLSPITVPFRGRQLQIAGDRTFEPWTVTILNDSGMEIRNKFEQWMNTMNSFAGNISANDNPATYMADASVHQLDRTGARTKSYTFNGIWPSNISSIDVSYDSENTVEEFTVEFQVTYWTSNTTDTP